MFSVNEFINYYVTKRSNSLFEKDITTYNDELLNTISEKSILVIGGAGSIGSSFINDSLF